MKRSILQRITAAVASSAALAVVVGVPGAGSGSAAADPGTVRCLRRRRGLRLLRLALAAVRQGVLPVRRRDVRDADRGPEPPHRLVRLDPARARGPRQRHSGRRRGRRLHPRDRRRRPGRPARRRLVPLRRGVGAHRAATWRDQPGGAAPLRPAARRAPVPGHPPDDHRQPLRAADVGRQPARRGLRQRAQRHQPLRPRPPAGRRDGRAGDGRLRTAPRQALRRPGAGLGDDQRADGLHAVRPRLRCGPGRQVVAQPGEVRLGLRAGAAQPAQRARGDVQGDQVGAPPRVRRPGQQREGLRAGA